MAEHELNPLPIDLAAIDDILSAYHPLTDRATIDVLQSMQAHYDYLPRVAMDALASRSGIPVARLYGVATFYSQFHLEPHGRHTIRVCRGTACHVRGANRILETISRYLGIGDGGTTPDMRFSIESVACLGTCFLAPVMLIDERYYGNLTPAGVIKILKTIQESDDQDDENR